MPRSLARTRHPITIPDVLVRWEPSRHAVLTVYADWRVDGRGVRDAAVTLRKDLHDAERSALARGPSRESLLADTESVREYLDESADPAARGLAIFACEGRGLWRAQGFRVPLPTLTHVGERPLLLPLAELAQDDRPCLVALADTTHVRMIAIRPSDIEQTAELVEDTWTGARLRARTGWRSGHEQHARETMLQRFTRDAVQAIEAAVRRASVDDLVVAGDAEITPALVEALEPASAAALRFVTSIDMRASLADVVEHVWPRLVAVGRTERAAEVDDLVERAGGEPGTTAAHDAVRDLLTDGMADTLAFDPAVLEPEVAEWLLREALAHGSRVIVARDHAALAASGGIVARSR